MVSQPEHSRTLALRAPSSVVSRSSRQRRQGRSHTGGASYVPLNNFPVFTHTGDIEILISTGGKENRYLLHRLILAQCSGFFEASTSQEWSRATEEGGGLETGDPSRMGENASMLNVTGSGMGAVSTTKKRWRYELDTGSGSDDVPMLVQKDSASSASLFNSDSQYPPPPVRNKPVPAHTGFFRSVANLSLPSNPQTNTSPISPEDEDTLRDYDNLFKIFYNYAPTLDQIDIAAAYTQCKTLLSLADMYDSLPVIGPRVDHHLLQFQGRLFKQIAKYPPSYLRLAYLARSKTIFKEALIHVVGQWPAGERHLRNTLPDNVLDLVEDKIDELADMLGRVEAKLFRVTLLTTRGERVTPSNSYSDWLVVSLFRQWLIEATNPPPPLPSKPSSSSRHRHRNDLPPPGSSRLLAQSPTLSQHIIPLTSRTIKMIGINQNPSAYLTHDECKKFLKLSTSEHYSRDSLKRFERRMDELKSLAAQVVREEGLMDNGVVMEGNIGYLTCVNVGEDDFPWEEEAS